MLKPFTRQVQWIKRTKHGGGSDYRGTTYDEAAPVATSAVFAPGGSVENVQGGDIVVTQPTLYCVDNALAVSALDVFVVDGARYEVDGDPAAGYLSPFTGWQPGQVIPLRKVAG